MKTLVLHTCFVVALGSLIGCGPMDDAELQHQEQAVYNPCLCIPGSLKCLSTGCLPPKPIPYCGDGKLSLWEECDKTALGGETCASLGYSGGTLSCNADCTYDTSGCTAICGDGLVQGTEQCDGADLAGATCASIGYRGGTLGCTSSCTFDLSLCEKCGDGIVNGPEECDGTAQVLPTCKSQGYDGGTVGCSATCEYDWSSCLQHYAGTLTHPLAILSWDMWLTCEVHYQTTSLGPLCSSSTDQGIYVSCAPGDLCIDPSTGLCGRYVKHAAGQIYSAAYFSGNGPSCGGVGYRSPSYSCTWHVPLITYCESGDVCTDPIKRECTRQ